MYWTWSSWCMSGWSPVSAMVRCGAVHDALVPPCATMRLRRQHHPPVSLVRLPASPLANCSGLSQPRPVASGLFGNQGPVIQPVCTMHLVRGQGSLTFDRLFTRLTGARDAEGQGGGGGLSGGDAGPANLSLLESGRTHTLTARSYINRQCRQICRPYGPKPLNTAFTGSS